MAKNKSMLIEFAEKNNLQYDKINDMAYGNSGGYELSISRPNKKSGFIIFMSLLGTVAEAGEKIYSDIKANVPNIRMAVEKQNGAVFFETQGAATQNKSLNNLQEAFDALPRYLQSKGLKSNCQGCGQYVQTTPYAFHETGMHLCGSCANNYMEKLGIDEINKKAKKENIALGAVGALLGSLVGVLAIVIIGQLGYVAAISGVIMAACALKGYEKFAGKMTYIGIAITVVIIIAMTLFGNRLDWAIFFVREFGGDIFYAFSVIKDAADPTLYYSGLAKLGIYTLVGSIVMIIPIIKAQRKPATFQKLSRNYDE